MPSVQLASPVAPRWAKPVTINEALTFDAGVVPVLKSGALHVGGYDLPWVVLYLFIKASKLVGYYFVSLSKHRIK